MTTESRFCIQCGEEIQKDSRFCSHCGTDLREESQPELSESKSTQPDSNASGDIPRTESVNDTPESIPDYSKSGGIVAAGAFAILPALGAEILFLYLLSSSSGAVFLLTLISFSYLFHQADTKADMAGQMCFWLGIEALLVPLVLFVFAVQTNETVIVSLVWIIVSAVVCVPVAGVLYLLSRRWTD